MLKVLFVCLGNICRSPLAEAVFNKLITDNQLNSRILSDSAGTAGYHIGADPDPRSVQVAKKNNIPINSKARKFHRDDYHEFDYILAMDSQNLADIQAVFRKSGSGNQPHKGLYLMRDFDDDAFKGEDVPDPYYGGDEGFDRVHEMLNRSCQNFLDFLKQEHHL